MSTSDVFARTLDVIESDLYELSEFLHSHVEPSGQECQSSDEIADFLAERGGRVVRGVHGMETSFIAEFGQPDSSTTVAFLCEYDGLPPYGQSCGHNIVTAASVGAGLLMQPVCGQLATRVLVVGTPAEEGFGGKYVMADRGVFENVDAAILVYPGATDVANPCTLFSRTVDVEVSGQAAHAALRPDAGTNALDSLVLGYTAVAMLRQHLPSGTRVHGIITDGGKFPQVVPDFAAGAFTVRAPTKDELVDACARVESCFVGSAQQTGALASTTWRDRTALPVRPNPSLIRAYERTLESLGRNPMPRPHTVGGWSTDAGYLSRVVPLLQPQFAMVDPNISQHSHEFHDASSGPAARAAIGSAALALATTAAVLANDSDLRHAVHRDFQEGECQIHGLSDTPP